MNTASIPWSYKVWLPGTFSIEWWAPSSLFPLVRASSPHAITHTIVAPAKHFSGVQWISWSCKSSRRWFYPQHSFLYKEVCTHTLSNPMFYTYIHLYLSLSILISIWLSIYWTICIFLIFPYPIHLHRRIAAPSGSPDIGCHQGHGRTESCGPTMVPRQPRLPWHPQLSQSTFLFLTGKLYLMILLLVSCMWWLFLLVSSISLHFGLNLLLSKLFWSWIKMWGLSITCRPTGVTTLFFWHCCLLTKYRCLRTRGAGSINMIGNN